jgi:hypothetical protein
MLTGFFRLRRKRIDAQPGFADTLGLSGGKGRIVPCELWTEYGIARIAEVKLHRPSPLATFLVQKAHT